MRYKKLLISNNCWNNAGKIKKIESCTRYNHLCKRAVVATNFSWLKVHFFSFVRYGTFKINDHQYLILQTNVLYGLKA